MKKRLLKWIMFCAGVYLGKPFIQMMFRLNKIVAVNGDIVDETLRSGRSVIFCFWHGRLLFPLYYFRGTGAYVVAGRHEDAEMAARVYARMGYRMIRGSSTWGGTQAYRELIEVLTNPGALVGITPDGPRGPKQKAKIGAVGAAVRTGAVLIPVSGQASRRWEIESWDTLVIPKPFGRASFIFGAPIILGENDNVQESCQTLERELNRVQDLADAAIIEKA